ncbi:Hypothetical_protein [Hexamita inflata]|uniref:Hypothetical_protein n=1 Tax=Hexamita inflata TaxID=28002 RepID=A0AA86P7W8_9EUKA|nr:Hypothetical protein HINF_LOCUS21372 [Hexamita inflata]
MKYWTILNTISVLTWNILHVYRGEIESWAPPSLFEYRHLKIYLIQNQILEIEITDARRQSHVETPEQFSKMARVSISESKSGPVWYISCVRFGFPFRLQTPFPKIF